MKSQLFRFLPIVLGIGIGWLILHPPAWSQGLGSMGWAVNGALCALLLLATVPLMALSALPAELRTRPLDPGQAPPELEELRREYLRLGFLEVGPPLRVEVAPAATVLGFVHQSEPVYGTVYRTTTIPAKTGHDFVSILEGERGGLTTCADPAGAVLPAAPGEFRQVLSGSKPETLLQAHLEGLRFLREQGLAPRAVSAEAFPRDLGAGIRHQRRTFLASPLRSSLLTFWRAATKQVPFVGRLSDQAVAARQVASLLAGQTGRAF
jgi:hypothetical protein